MLFTTSTVLDLNANRSIYNINNKYFQERLLANSFPKIIIHFLAALTSGMEDNGTPSSRDHRDDRRGDNSNIQTTNLTNVENTRNRGLSSVAILTKFMTVYSQVM